MLLDLSNRLAPWDWYCTCIAQHCITLTLYVNAIKVAKNHTALHNYKYSKNSVQTQSTDSLNRTHISQSCQTANSEVLNVQGNNIRHYVC